MGVSGLTELILLICTSAIWGQSCFLVRLASCIPLASQQSPWGVAALLGCSWGARIHIWRSEISDSCDISCLLIWKEIFIFYTLIKSHWQTNLVFVKTDKTFQLCFMETKIILILYVYTILIGCFIIIANVAGLNTFGNKKLAL